MDQIQESKPFYRSAAFWGLIATLVGLALTGLGQGRPLLDLLGDDAVQGTIGEILTALGLSASLFGRARATGPLTLRREGETDTRGNVRLGLLLTLGGGALLALALASGGCGTREIRTDGPVMVEYWSGPPCRVVVVADGERVLDARSPVKCVLPGGD